jgi:SHS2 domain-containing protein
MAEHSYEQQPGEVRIQLAAERIEDLFDEAARALAELIAIPTHDPPGPWQHVVVDSPDHRALFVLWCNELIERSAIDHLVYSDVEIDEVSATQVRARIRGVPIEAPRTTVKMATMHDLQMQSGPGAVSASVVVEVYG